MMRTRLASVVFIALLLAGAILHLGIGARFIPPQSVAQAFLAFDPRNFDHNVIINLRLLRLLAALMTGAALGVAGVLLQAVIRNPLGEPHILGLNAGAALAVVLTSALGLTFPFGRPLIAAAGAGGIIFAGLNAVVRWSNRINPHESDALRRRDFGICLVNHRCSLNSG
ncbi:transport system permease [Lelliottia amnigena]|nr:transport system permease [Lelliottia amnigena]